LINLLDEKLNTKEVWWLEDEIEDIDNIVQSLLNMLKLKKKFNAICIYKNKIINKRIGIKDLSNLKLRIRINKEKKIYFK